MKQVAENVLHSRNLVVSWTRGDVEDKRMRDEGKRAQDWLGSVDLGTAVCGMGAEKRRYVLTSVYLSFILRLSFYLAL